MATAILDSSCAREDYIPLKLEHDGSEDSGAFRKIKLPPAGLPATISSNIRPVKVKDDVFQRCG